MPAARAVWGLLAAYATVEAGTPEGLDALKQGDFRAAHREFSAAAKQGEAEAQFQLGELCLHGRGVPASPQQAAKWYELAVGQEHAGAAGRLGVLLWRGSGVAKDKARGAKLLLKGAEGGSAIAQYEIGLLRHYGGDVGITEEQGYEFVGKAAEQGHAEAQFEYGRFLREGKIGGSPDKTEAEAWFRKAAEQGHAEAASAVASLARDRNADAESDNWSERAALLGDFGSQFYLGLRYMQIGKDAESYAWLLVASDLRNSWPAPTELTTQLYEKQSKLSKETAAKQKKALKSDEVRKGTVLAKEYIATARENIRKGRP